MSIEDLQAFIVLRGSTLGPDDKKRVILEGDQASSRKLTIKKVGESIRLLGASFFMDVTGQKKMKDKVYDQIALTVEEAQEPAENFLSEDMTEEKYIEAMIAEGEDDVAALVADFESSASELIQEDTELAQAFTAYQDARRRLSEKFWNRGFFPTSRGGGFKGKGYGGKNQSKGGQKGFRPERALQERILQSTCRACGRKGHWKAECPFKGGSGSASNQGASTQSSMPTTTLIASEADSSHPGIPADSSEPNVMTQCPIDEEPWLATAHVLGIMGNHSGERSNRKRLGDAMYYYYGDRVRKESKSNKDMEPPMTARQRLQSRLPRTKTHTTESDNPDRRSHFAREHPMSHRQSRNHVACVPVANRTMSQQSSTCEDSVFFWIMVQPESWIICPA